VLEKYNLMTEVAPYPLIDAGIVFLFGLIYGYLEKLEFSFKIKTCEKFNRRHIVDIPRIKF
jgi:hypothetical protein